MRKILIKTTLAILLVFALASMFFSSNASATKRMAKAQSFIEELHEEIKLALEDNIVYDQDNISIYVTDISKNGSRIDFEIKNNADFDIYCVIRSIVINGFSLDSAYHETINPKSTGNYHVELSNSKKKLFSIDNIETLRFQISIHNKEEDVLIDRPTIEIKTTSFNTDRQFNYDNFELLNSDNGISIYYLKVDNEDNPYLLLVSNEIDEDVIVLFADVQFDDVTLPPIYKNVYVSSNSVYLDKGIYSDNPAIQVVDNIPEEPDSIKFNCKVTIIDEEGNTSRKTFKLNNLMINLK